MIYMSDYTKPKSTLLGYFKVFQSPLSLSHVHMTIFQIFTHFLPTQDCRMLKETTAFIREQNMLIL